MGSDELADLLPETLQGFYLDSGLNYRSCEFVRVRTGTTSGVPSYCGGDRPYFEYETSVTGQGFEYPYAPIFKIDIPVQISNVTYLSWRCGAWVNLNNYRNANANDIASYSYMHYLLDGADNTAPLLRQENNINHAETFRLSGGVSRGYSCILYNYSGSAVTFKSVDMSGCFMYQENGVYSIMISSPVINDDYMEGDYEPDFDGGASVGVITGDISDNGDGSQSVNITIEQDNSGLISGIISGFKNLFSFLFIPDEDFMNDWQAGLRDDFNEHLGAAAEVVNLMDEHADYLRNAVATNTIYFPGVSFPDAGGTVHQLIAAQDVELQPFKEGRMRPLYTAAALAVDLICLFAVFNMLQDKYEIFLNPDAEVINYDN